MTSRFASMVLLFALVACGESPATQSDPPASADVPFATSTVPSGSTPSTEVPGTTSPPTTTNEPTDTMAGAPPWFDLDRVAADLSTPVDVFDLTDASAYRFRSTVTLFDEPGLTEEQATVELLGEVSEQPPAVHWLLSTYYHREQLIAIGGQTWVNDKGVWEEINGGPFGEIHLWVGPIFSYETAAGAAGSGLTDGAVTFLAEEEVNGFDTVHLRVFHSDGFTDTDAELWINSSGLLVSAVFWLSDTQNLELTWDLYDLGGDIEIQPPSKPAPLQP